MSHRADELSVLNYGTAGHSLDYSARFFKQGRICDGDCEIFLAAAGVYL